MKQIRKLVKRADAARDTFGVVVLIDEVGPYPGLVRAIGHHYGAILAHIREELEVDHVVLAVAGTGALKFFGEWPSLVPVVRSDCGRRRRVRQSVDDFMEKNRSNCGPSTSMKQRGVRFVR